MSKIKISDVLHLAADKYLDDGVIDLIYVYSRKHVLSCCAIESAVYEVLSENSSIFSCSTYDTLMETIEQGLTNMGLAPQSTEAFKEFENSFHKTTPESQGARYAWLKFAAMIAEEQGV